MVGLVKFVNEVKIEAGKIAWPTQKETMGSALVVLGSVLVASLVFLLIDTVAYRLIQWVLHVGN